MTRSIHKLLFKVPIITVLIFVMTENNATMSLYTYFDELDAVSKVRYKKKLSVLNIPECPYRFPEGVWENNPTKWPDLEWGDLYSYLVESPDCKVLDDYIQHYEELHYDADIVHETHTRHKRSADHILHLPLDAFGRKLHLELKKDSSSFTDGYQTELSNGTLVDVDLSFLYSGKVRGIPGSYCHGSVIQGVFQGSIHLPDEVYHVQKSRHFFDDQPVFHSVIYRESDMNLDPFKERRERERREARELGSCGYDTAVEWMRDVQGSEVIENNRPVRSAMEWQEIHTGPHNKYSARLNEGQQLHREKRQQNIINLGVNNTCILELRSDPVFWDRYIEISSGNAELARDEILAFFNSHVQAINRIYGNTLFTTYDNSIGYGYVQFAVQRTKVFTRPDDCNPTATSESKYCKDGIDVSNFLNLNSLEKHDEFCLSYMFTNRDFMHGTLGLAWVGASDSSSGGICEKWKRFRENGQDIYKSLNTGVVTNKNYAKQVPSKVSQLTFAHEVGHNFGSPHDSGVKCAPYGTSESDASEGNYIMFASATMGDKVHNSEFSSCSKDNITRVLDAVIRQLYEKKNCFQAKGPFCGNGIVEEGEECDCGFEDQCDDQCCNPKKKDDKGDPNNLKCTRKTTAVCSPSEGPCCTRSCGFVPLSANQTCKYAQDCSEASYCSGNSASCPEPVKKPDGSYCNNYGFTCKDGECGGSLCERFGWTECFITSTDGEKIDKKEEQQRLCKLACTKNGTQDCVISSDPQVENYPLFKQMVEEVRLKKEQLNRKDKSPAGITLAADILKMCMKKFDAEKIFDDKQYAGVSSSPCNNYQGYCDVFSRCRGVDAEGPLTRLKNLIFDPATLETISDWIVEHWWAVLLMAIGLVIAMGLFIKFCAVHTPSSNPKAKPARKLTDTLRRRRNPHPSQSQPQQVRYPQQQYYDRRSYQNSVGQQQQQQQELLPDPKYPAKNPQGPPPPYPGSSHPSSSAGPPHGHGKKQRKHRDMEMGRV